MTDNTQTPLERAARALHKLYTEEKERSGAKEMPSWDGLGNDGKFYFTHRARAVLEAIREPSEAMEAAYEYEHEAQCLMGLAPDTAWRTMIDAALGE